MTTAKTHRDDSSSATPEPATTNHGRGPAVVITLVLATVVFVALLVFVAQNSQSVKFSYFGADATIGFGVALLIAAAAGALLAALVGTVVKIRRSVRSRH